MIVFGSGGHTTEMLLMLKTLNFEKYREVVFVIGHSDTWSKNKIYDYFSKNRQDIDLASVQNLRMVTIFRSREVKQAYTTSIATTLTGLGHAVIILIKYFPDIVRLDFSKSCIDSYKWPGDLCTSLLRLLGLL
jgi:beta-1,4-N-acetylglucosaminyltransferase